jgi:hypothetical protein
MRDHRSLLKNMVVIIKALHFRVPSRSVAGKMISDAAYSGKTSVA